MGRREISNVSDRYFDHRFFVLPAVSICKRDASIHSKNKVLWPYIFTSLFSPSIFSAPRSPLARPRPFPPTPVSPFALSHFFRLISVVISFLLFTVLRMISLMFSLSFVLSKSFWSSSSFHVFENLAHLLFFSLIRHPLLMPSQILQCIYFLMIPFFRELTEVTAARSRMVPIFARPSNCTIVPNFTVPLWLIHLIILMKVFYILL